MLQNTKLLLTCSRWVSSHAIISHSEIQAKPKSTRVWEITCLGVEFIEFSVCLVYFSYFHKIAKPKTWKEIRVGTVDNLILIFILLWLYLLRSPDLKAIPLQLFWKAKETLDILGHNNHKKIPTKHRYRYLINLQDKFTKSWRNGSFCIILKDVHLTMQWFPQIARWTALECESH